MNRMALGLAVGAGYVLGRTKKMKLAVALGSLAAGKRMQLGPRAIAELVNKQLVENPQLKEIGDEIRQDLRGVGKAASGALVERQMTALADRLHGRTEQVRDQVAGVVPDVPGLDQEDEEPEAREDEEEAAEDEEEPEAREDEEEPAAGEQAPAKKAMAPAKKAAKKAPATKKAAAVKRTAPAKKAAKKTPARKQAAGQGAARRTSEGRRR